MTEETKKVETLPVEFRANMLAAQDDLFFNIAKFEHAQRVVAMLSSATMLPDHFQNNAGNCLIALNYADRIKADPFMVMQTMYIIHGKPGIEGKLVAALINQSAKYSEPLVYEFGTGSKKDEEFDSENTSPKYGCRAVTVDAKSGKRVAGPRVTWAIVKAGV